MVELRKRTPEERADYLMEQFMLLHARLIVLEKQIPMTMTEVVTRLRERGTKMITDAVVAGQVADQLSPEELQSLRHAQQGLADLLCWSRGFMAASDVDKWPLGIDECRELNSWLKSVLDFAEMKK